VRGSWIGLSLLGTVAVSESETRLLERKGDRDRAEQSRAKSDRAELSKSKNRARTEQAVRQSRQSRTGQSEQSSVEQSRAEQAGDREPEARPNWRGDIIAPSLSSTKVRQRTYWYA
jgi:hypothetical protein